MMSEYSTPLSIEYPIFLLLPFLIPVLYWIFRQRPGKGTKTNAILPTLPSEKGFPRSLREQLRQPVLITLSMLTIIFASIGASRPYSIKTIMTEEARKNLMLVIDTSESMATNDFYTYSETISRLKAAQNVVAQFVQQRARDRIGLVIFGHNAFLQTPLTLDHTVIQVMLQQLRPGIAGNGTAIGDGLGLAIKRIINLKNQSRAIILLTDGANNSGRLNPIEAAKLAHKFDIKVHTIGVGSTAHADYDEKTLRKISKITNGTHFNAKDLDTLRAVYAEINELESSIEEEKRYNFITEYYWISALMAIVCYGLYQVMQRSLFMIVP
jgi:Ca-activated chloride channel family protein